mgnify:CR=1 FL=1
MKFRVLFPFGGSGGGALGFIGAEARLFGHVGCFEALGSIDFDREACEDFERFVGAPAWCADVEQITAAEVPLCMIAVKLARQSHRHKRDNLVDIAGYSRTAAMVAGEE